LALVVTAVALVVYVATLAPDLTVAHNGTDGGDLIAAARTLGVPHPTGYPTYTLLAWLFSHLPFGTIAYRVNLLSAVCAAVAAGLFFRAAQIILPAGESRPLTPLLAALALAFSPLYWSQAVISEVYALLALFAALVLLLLVRWWRGGPDRLLWLAALSLGLGLGNHLTLIFVLPGALILLWPQRQRWLRPRTLLPAVAFFTLGVMIYVYLPLAARHRPPVNWGNPQTWDRFLSVVTARQYQDLAFGLETSAIPARLYHWAGLLGDQFGWWGLALLIAGGWWVWQRSRSLALFSATWILLAAAYAFFYDTGDSHVYLIPAILLLALWWGEGIQHLLGLGPGLRRIWRRLILIAVICLPLASLILHWRTIDPDDDWEARAFIDEVLNRVEDDGLIILRGDRPTFALWYGVYAEGKRPDVALVSGPLLAFVWYRDQARHQYPDLVVGEPTVSTSTFDDLVHTLIEDNLPHRAVYATDPGESWEQWFDFIQQGDSPVYRAYPEGERGE
jgi:hypothetical protein